MSAARIPLTVVILTHDEELNLPACLESVTGWARDVFVVDSGSVDRTVEIAESAGATVAEHAFETHALQWEWALDNLPIETEWVMGLDADQRVTRALADELAGRFGRGGETLEGTDGLYVCRRQIFRGTWIRHGGYYPKYLLKIFRRDRVFSDPHDLIDHHFHVPGRTERLEGDIVEANRKEDDLTFWLEKHLRYAERMAEEEVRRGGAGDRAWPLEPKLTGSPDQRTLWLKRLWYRLPLFVRPFLYFAWRYVGRLGFLDGRDGFVFHFFQGFWYRMVVDVHLHDLRTGRGTPDEGNRMVSGERRTG